MVCALALMAGLFSVSANEKASVHFARLFRSSDFLFYTSQNNLEVRLFFFPLLKIFANILSEGDSNEERDNRKAILFG